MEVITLLNALLNTFSVLLLNALIKELKQQNTA